MTKSRHIGRYCTFLILAAAIAGAGWWYFRRSPAAVPVYQTVTLKKGSIVQAVTATGVLQPIVIVDVGSQVSGRLKDVLVDFNDKVAKDQVLARIDPATFESALAQAESELLNARANLRLQRSNLERSRKLSEQNLVSSSALEQLEATLEQAEAAVRIREFAVDSRKTDLERCTIVAPIDGMVISRNVQTGQTVAASLNAPVLFTIANDLARMQIAAAISEADIGSIADGQAVKFTVDAYPGRGFTGKVRQVRNAAKSVENVVTYEAIIDVENPGGRLKPGMTANVSVIIQSREDALRLANAALRVRLPQGLEVSIPPEPERPGRTGGGAPGDGGGGGEAAAAAAPGDMEGRGSPGGGGAPGGEDPDRRARFMEAMAANPEMAARFRDRAGRGAPTASRVVFKLVGPPEAQKLEAVRVRTGISDGSFTEVVDGLQEGDTIVTSVVLPGAKASSNASSQMRAFGSDGGVGGRGFRGF